MRGTRILCLGTIGCEGDYKITRNGGYWGQNCRVVKATSWYLGFNPEQQFITSLHADEWHATQNRPLHVWNSENMPISSKPVFCPFLNYWINFWIVVQVFLAQLRLICVQQIQVWPYLSVEDIDEQCDFLDRMDFDAIFQQINLRYEWAIRVSAILTLNRMDVDMIFFSFKVAEYSFRAVSSVV